MTNASMPGCDPQGYPRIVLHNAHHEQIIETATQVIIPYQSNKKWRVIWTDRVDADHIEKTLVIDDPKYYSRQMGRLRAAAYEAAVAAPGKPAQECVPSETAKYNRLDAVAAIDGAAK